MQSLAHLRDLSPFSSRNISKGALIKENYALFCAVRKGLSLFNVRQAILSGEIFQKSSYETRNRIWDTIHYRYLSVCLEWIGNSLAVATEKGMQSPDFLSLAYLYNVLRDRLTFEFVTGPIWKRWQEGLTNIDRGNFISFLAPVAEEFPHVKKWRESSKEKLASNALSPLRDFGLLRGKQIKHIQRPSVTPETTYHLLCVLVAEGKEGIAITEAPDWRLFLWTEADISNALNDLSQRKWIRFEKAGQTVILQLIRIPEVLK